MIDVEHSRYVAFVHDGRLGLEARQRGCVHEPVATAFEPVGGEFFLVERVPREQLLLDKDVRYFNMTLEEQGKNLGQFGPRPWEGSSMRG